MLLTDFNTVVIGCHKYFLLENNNKYTTVPAGSDCLYTNVPIGSDYMHTNNS